MNSKSMFGGGLGAAERSTLIAYALMVLIGGGNTVAVRLSNFGLPPLWGVATRVAATALIFWVIVSLRRIALPRGRALLGAVLYGLLNFTVAGALVYWGLVRVPAGVGSTILALVPLMTLFFAWAHGLEQLRGRGVAGALIAVSGVSIGVAGGFGGTVHLPAVLAVVAAAAALAEAAVVFKLFPRSDPLATNAVAFTAGAPVLFVLSRLVGESWILPSTAATWAAFGYLVLIGSVVQFYLYVYVLSRLTASATAYSFLLVPVATVVIAAVLLGEAITTPFVIGAALVLAGVWVGAIQAPQEAVEAVCPEFPSRAVC
ncbi:MAG: DMT family transporter [Anaerolineales bacterium]|nr:MAG: DMT family transporter [Anaerolineales bacterium]